MASVDRFLFSHHEMSKLGSFHNEQVFSVSYEVSRLAGVFKKAAAVE